MRTALAMLSVSLLLSSAVGPACAAGTPSGDYADRVLLALTAMVQKLPGYVQVAEGVAGRLAGGGKLFLDGDRGFILEGLGRAGGLMMVKQLGKLESLSAADVVLYGSFSPIEGERAARVKQLSERAGLVVQMTPTRVELPTWAFELERTGASASDPTQAAPLLVASLWTLTGELVAALTRLDKLPPMYQSVLVPGGRERNAEHLKLQWEPGPVTPLPPLLLGRQYLSEIATDLRSLKVSQAGKLTAVGRLARETKAAGHTVWYASLGHLMPELPTLPGDPQVTTPLPGNNPDKLADNVKPGDLILYVGYYEPYGPWVQTAHAAGAKIVTLVSGSPELPAESTGAEIAIRGCWPFGDTAVAIPGYDVRVLPPSGFVDAAAYYMLLAEVAAGG